MRSRSMHVDDATRLRHMLDAAREAVYFAQGKTREDLDGNRQLVLSLVKCIEIIGEAAAKITLETRQQHEQIPWQTIVATRNRLIHGYYDIDVDRVWDTVTHSLPPLVAELEKMVKS